MAGDAGKLACQKGTVSRKASNATKVADQAVRQDIIRQNTQLGRTQSRRVGHVGEDNEET